MTGLELEVVAKEGRYKLNPSLDSWVTCRMMGLSGAMH
jgi:hypothetical protein